MTKKHLSTLLLIASTLFLIACSTDSPSQPNTSARKPPPSNIINWREVPQACNSFIEGNTVSFELTFQKWTWKEIDVLDGTTMHTTQIFTGLEDADLKFMCDDRKNDEKSGKIKGIKTTNVICNGNVVSADDIISPQKHHLYHLL